MPGNVNIRKVATAAGVSAPIVSAVLGGKDPLHGNVRFSRETAEKIKRVAAEMGYVSNRLAKVLIRRETFAIGVLAPFERHERYDAIIRALSEKCQSKGYHLIATSCSFSHEDQMAKLRSLMSLQVNIVVMIPVASEKIDLAQVMKEHKEKQQLFPNLLCVDWLSDELVFDCVEPDEKSLIELPLQHLKAQGHRIVGMIGACSQKRHEILMETLAALDMEESLQAVLTGFRPFNVSESDVPDLTRKILSLRPRPTALYCWHDLFAAIAYRVCEREFDLKIGKDIALIGQDNTVIAKSLPVPLTSFDLKDKELASVLFDIIEAKIEGMDGQSPLRKTVKPELVIRESSAFKVEV